MKKDLNKLIGNLRKMGYGDYGIKNTGDNLIITFPNIKELHHNDKNNLIKKFGVTIEITDSEITIIY